MNEAHDYEEIIDMPYHKSEVHQHMSRYDRAAQFSPFAALTGHEDAIEETGRLTVSKADIDESVKEKLDAELIRIIDKIDECPYISVTYYKPDEKKSGGAYITYEGNIRKIDEYARTIVMDNEINISFDDIVELKLIQGKYAE